MWLWRRGTWWLPRRIVGCRWHGIWVLRISRGGTDRGGMRVLGIGPDGPVMRFPPEAADVPLTVRMDRRGDAEVWIREFAGCRFRSTLRLHRGQMTERFGALTFAIALRVQGGVLQYPVTKGWFLGIPMPRWALPRSDTAEGADGGRATFDVALSLPVIGPVVRYQGWLVPA